MVVADTNVLIYIAQGKLDVNVFGDRDIAYASITRIEALGYQKITVAEARWLIIMFEARQQLDLDEAVLTTAIRLRQERKISLDDSIVAASALEADAELWTANTQDFAGIDGLRLHNPLSS